MKSILIASTFTAALFVSTGTHAGADASCHFHGSKPAVEATVIECATQYKNKLVEGGKLEKSWQTVTKVDKLEQIDGKRSKEWKLSFKNPAAADKTKDTLYLFYTLPGNLIAANHTGQ
jgi:kynurenine formamidase